MIAAQGLIGSGTGNLACYSGGFCGIFPNATTDVYCTDFSTVTDYSIGERYDTFTLPLTLKFIIGFYSNAWLALAIGGGGNSQVTSQINLVVRPDGIINTSPVTSTFPVIYRIINTQHVHVIQMSDADGTDTLRCRWSSSNSPVNFNGYDECGSVCAPTLPSFTLYPNNCTLIFTITALNYYAVALQIEDYYNSTTTIPMSSVPIQFLFYGIATPTGCSAPPQIIGARPNLACIGVQIGVSSNETIIAQVGCVGKSIVEFTTSSPIGVIQTAITSPSTGIYMMSIMFTPISAQYGPQIFCAAAIDNTYVQSDPWCVTFLVGFTAPTLQYGSASPVGTVLQTQSIFSIQIQNGATINRPTSNGTFVHFNDATLNNTVVLEYDCCWSGNVNYSGSTMTIYAPYSWIPGHVYYITFDSGVATGNEYCSPQSAPVTDPSFWQFNIWGLSITTTTATTATTTTVTTTTMAPNYVCNQNNDAVEFTQSSSFHSAWKLTSNCSLQQCQLNSRSNSSCLSSSSTPCFDYRTLNNSRYCAPGILCAILLPCNNITHTCASNTSVCVVNSCCSPQAVCLPLSVTNFCVSGWVSTGSMNNTRYYHTASVLQNGQVLVAGGESNIGNLNSAELYDSSLEIWTATGDMTNARYAHTASMLQNGKVLVTGGYSNVGNINSAELYDPLTGTWTATGNMTNARYYHTASVLQNGKVLVTGGWNNGACINSAELYDPLTGTWTGTGNMINTRCYHTASALQNGQVLITGGVSNVGALNSAELYDPLAETWLSVANMNYARSQHTASVLANGKILVTGGTGSTTYMSSTELYDLTTGNWTTIGSMYFRRNYHTASVLTNGNVLVTGGHDGSGWLNNTELFNSITGTWTTIGNMNNARLLHTTSVLTDGTVLVAGGTSFYNPLNTAELYQLS